MIVAAMRSIPRCFLLAFALLATPALTVEAPDWAVAVLPSGDEFSLEIAADPESRRLGYMYREKVGPSEGMLFLFDTSAHHAIWMRNCKTSLDIVWLDETFRVQEIAHDQQPCPDGGDCRSIFPLRPARYVLEVAGGTARREGLARGDQVVILSEPALQ